MLRKANLMDKDSIRQAALLTTHRNTATMAKELALKEKPGVQMDADDECDSDGE